MDPPRAKSLSGGGSRRRRTRLLAAALPWLATLSLLGGVELAARLTLPHAPALEALVADPRALRGILGDVEKRRRLERVRAFEADPLLFWRLRSNLDQVIWAGTLVSTNAAGYRYPRDVGPKTDAGFRVLCFGDSVTFGYQVPLVFWHSPEAYDRDARHWTELLEERLAARLPGRDVEVIPLAVPGYTSHQGRTWLERDLARLEPDAVIAAFGWNDTDLRAVSDHESMPQGWLHRLSRRVVLSSQAMIHTAAWLRPDPTRKVSPPAAGAVPRVPREHFVDNHLAMARTARRHGAPMLAIGPIYRDPPGVSATARRMAEHRATLEAAMGAGGIAYLEVEELTGVGYPGNAPLFIEAVHPNPSGHALLACEVERKLVEAGMLPAGNARLSAPTSGR